jgi:hypothetical protein
VVGWAGELPSSRKGGRKLQKRLVGKRKAGHETKATLLPHEAASLNVQEKDNRQLMSRISITTLWILGFWEKKGLF